MQQGAKAITPLCLHQGYQVFIHSWVSKKPLFRARIPEFSDVAFLLSLQNKGQWHRISFHGDLRVLIPWVDHCPFQLHSLPSAGVHLLPHPVSLTWTSFC